MRRIEHIVAALSPADRRMLGQYGSKVIDEVTSGPYHLYLVYEENMELYQLGLDRDDTSFATDSFEKVERKSGTTMMQQHAAMTELAQKTKEWATDHQPMYFGSPDPRKEDAYAQALRWYGVTVVPGDLPGGPKYKIVA